MDGTMMSVKRSVVMGAGAAALALIGALAIGSLPIVSGLAVASAVFAALGYVAATAQRRHFDDESRLVYRPVYVRSRNVDRRRCSFDD